MNTYLSKSIPYFAEVKQGFREIKRLNLSTLRKVFSLMGKSEKTVFIGLTLLAVISTWYVGHTLYTHATHPAPGYGGTYREAVVGQPRLINPVLATSSSDLALMRLVYGSLYTYDEQGNLIPELADGQPQISEDQKEYTVKLKPNAKFQNDRQVTADDVIFTVQTVQNPAFKSPYKNDWANTTVEKVDNLTLKFRNRNVSAPFQHTLTLPILPAKVWQNISSDTFPLSELNLKAIGSGPYKIREINKLPSGDVQKITLESFHDYILGRPYIDRVVISFFDTTDDAIHAYQSGEVSGVGYVPFGQNSDVSLNHTDDERIPLPQYQALFFNTSNPILADKNIRSALRLAIPKASIISDIYNGDAKELNTAILPEQLGFTTIPEVGEDLATANTLLNQAGWPVNDQNLRAKKNTPFTLTIITNDNAVNTKTAERIASEWKKLNITVNITSVPTKELTDSYIKTRNFDVLLFGQKLNADPDPFVFWHSSQTKDPGLNVSGFTNAEVDSLLTEARSTVIPEIRQDRYERFLEIMNTEVPAVFLNQGVYVYTMQSEIKHPAIQGLYDTSYRFGNIYKWYIKESRKFN